MFQSVAREEEEEEEEEKEEGRATRGEMIKQINVLLSQTTALRPPSTHPHPLVPGPHAV